MENVYKLSLNNGKFIKMDDEGMWLGNEKLMGEVSPQTLVEAIVENGIAGWVKEDSSEITNSKNLNYELLLDDLVEELLSEIAELDKKIMESKVQDFRYGLNLGLRDGMMKAIIGLHMKENRSKKYLIK